ncbi:MAG: hypothetical protein ACODAJ_10195 [Planctomycetota bacterium]
MRRALLWLCVVGVAMLGVTDAAVAGPVSGDPAPPGEIAIQVSPGTIALEAQTVWLTIHADIPYAAVNPETVVVEVEGKVVDWTGMFADSQGDLVVKCPIDPAKDVVEDMASATVVLSGLTWASEAFVGADTVKVVSGSRR